MIKINLLIVLIFYALTAQAAITIKPLDDNRMLVSGSIENSYMSSLQGYTYNDYMELRMPDALYRYKVGLSCNTGRTDTVNNINKFLSKGLVFIKVKERKGNTNTLHIFCNQQDSNYPLEWQISHNVDTILPAVPKCVVSAQNTEVDFGTITRGVINQKKNVTINVKCNKDTKVTLTIQNAVNNMIAIGSDAKISALFNNNKSIVSDDFSKNITSGKVIDLTIKDTGETTGLKSGFLIVQASWD